MTDAIHRLELVALLVPFIGLSLVFFYVVFYLICWKGSR